MQHTLDQLNAADADTFTTVLGGIFEHSPWIARAAAPARPYDSVTSLHAAMCGIVRQADRAQQRALITAHPELAGKAAVRGELTDESTREQRGAGLDQCTPQELLHLQSLNAAYREKFGFPFIVAVRGYGREAIIALLEQRLTSQAEDELQQNLEQIFKIAALRLSDLIAV
jgi:2-oxo-4-hydroxy-4-carboxy-5-ureidoimidazoline decarboxylase